ncbi:hypothetical protein HMPREF0972_02280 [Actinomyces sp. oral taxon 848 str. F0332]|nr:hypothetical protein HMPREF0972_02280 [Actinomyces sp. oral taxon 848 str. F0332]
MERPYVADACGPPTHFILRGGASSRGDAKRSAPDDGARRPGA